MSVFRRKEVIGNATLYLGDCLDILPTLDPVDAVVTDPPYGIALPCDFASRKRGALAACNDWPDVDGDDEPFDPTPWLAVGRARVLWGGNWFSSRLPDSGGWLVWDKERPDGLDQATCELAWTDCVKGVRRFRHLWNGMMRASEHGENYHPTQKPVALYSWVFSLKWIPSGTVLDPYMGSAPCGIAAINSGRAYIGIEKHPTHFDIACDRIDQAQRQQRLFA